MFLFKLKAYIMGALLSLLPTNVFTRLVGGTKPIIGLDIVHDDFNVIDKFKPKIVRINYVDFKKNKSGFTKYFTLNDIGYYIQIGKSEDSLDEIGRQIIECENDLNGYKKPLFYSIINEDNDFTWYKVGLIEQYIRIHHGKPINITKGSYTSIVESAGLKKYKGHIENHDIPISKFHLIHFYLKPYNVKSNKIDNILRILMLKYLIFALSRNGLKADKIIISESHDASKDVIFIIDKEELRPYTENEGNKDGDKILDDLGNNKLLIQRYEGDFVFSSKDGWLKLEELFNTLGVYAGLFYHAPFLGYRGNTVLEARDEKN